MSESEEHEPSDPGFEQPAEDVETEDVETKNVEIKRRSAAMPFIMVTLFIDILGIGIIIPVLPELIKEFVGSDNSDSASFYYGVIIASYALMQFLFAPVMGALSDRFGRRPIILAALFGLGVDYLIQGLAPTLGWLFVGRLFAGMLGGSISTANAYIADVSTPENRARNYGLVGVTFGLGFICGPALGGILGDIYLRLPFFASAGFALLNWLYGFFVLPESLAPENRSTLSLRKANPFGAVAQIGKYPIVAGLAIAFVCSWLAQRGLENVWVLYTGYRYGWDERTNGFTLALVGVMAALVQGGLVRVVIKRMGERRTVSFGLVISALAFACYGLASEGWMIPLIIIFGALGGVAGPALQSIVAGSVGPSDQGKVQGGLTSLMGLCNIVSPLFFTAFLFGHFSSDDAIVPLPGAPFFVGAGLLLTALLVITIVFSKFPQHPADDDEIVVVDDHSGQETEMSIDAETARLMGD